MSYRLKTESISAFILILIVLGNYAKCEQIELTEQSLKRWGQKQIVFVGTLKKVKAGPVSMSMPPIYSHQLTFEIQRVLRGEVDTTKPLVTSHVARQKDSPVFPKGAKCLVTADLSRQSIRVDLIEEVNTKNLAEAELACAVPIGWSFNEGKLTCPWKKLGKAAWPKDVGDFGVKLKCETTKRPALLCGKGIQFQTEKVPPAKKIKWTNPDGDGQYKITVTNTTDQPLKIPALLNDGQNILWKHSLLIVCQNKTYTIPGCTGLLGKVKPTILKPGESVSTVVNALALQGPKWPRGGYRIEFQFCLGEKSSVQSFYYMSRHHDGIRKKLNQQS